MERIFKEAFPYLVTLLIGYAGFWLQQLTKKSQEVNQEQKQKEKLTNDALCCLLRVKMMELHDNYTKIDCINPQELDNYSSMYESYHGLGGNGMIDHMYEDVQELKIIK